MAQTQGVRGAWGYPEGGMGAVTQAMARSAQAHGASIYTNQVATGDMLLVHDYCHLKVERICNYTFVESEIIYDLIIIILNLLS